MRWRKIHQIDVIGSDTFKKELEQNDHTGFPRESFILRLSRKPKTPLFYKYLVIVEENKTIINSKLPPFDIFIFKNFLNYKLTIKQIKKLNRKNIGIEIKIRDIRNCNSSDVGKWVKCVKEIYKFCKLTNNQIIISSGADNKYETISGTTFDSILKIFEVDPSNYWNDLEKWLYLKSGLYYSASETR
jgi:hypothetical protein